MCYLKKKKNAKSLGLNIYSEYPKAGRMSLINALLYLFNYIPTTGSVPEALLVLYKRISPFECATDQLIDT